MLKADREGVHFTQIGTAGRALRRENYAAETLREVDHVAHDIEAAEPCGRLALLTGPPGNGEDPPDPVDDRGRQASPLRRAPAG